jgi:hypothetical protein
MRPATENASQFPSFGGGRGRLYNELGIMNNFTNWLKADITATNFPPLEGVGGGYIMNFGQFKIHNIKLKIK